MERKLHDYLQKDWKFRLENEIQSPYFQKLEDFIQEERKQQEIFPEIKSIFNAFEIPFDEVKVIILGQDPYHGVGQAHGYSFSVQEGVKFPPSLKNIFKEIQLEGCAKTNTSGDLSVWARQGVLLLNSTLTVRKGEAGSHQNKGWELFTDSIIKLLANEKENLVFMLWGNYAQSKVQFIDRNKHLVLEAPHPSPLSAYKGWFGCNHFKLCNDYLLNHHAMQIDWST